MVNTRTNPLNVSFVITSLPVGGAETLLVNLVRRMNKALVQPHVLCLKDAGELGESVACEVPLKSRLLSSKYDFRILPRLISTFRDQQTDAVITVGAGDKMFWGRLAARIAGVPVICSALHSTGWPDGVGKLNRMLTCITDGFIACAANHAQHMIDHEGFPRSKVFTIPNGVDTQRFEPNPEQRHWLRSKLRLADDTKLVGIVAALREEKNHQQLIDASTEILREHPSTHFVVVGDGPMRPSIEASIQERGVAAHFHLLGNRHDTHQILPGLDAFVLTSKNEANPVSILEALACGVPVAAPRVGSIHETVLHEKTGLLTVPLDPLSTADAIIRLLGNAAWSRQLGLRGRTEVQQSWSLETMVGGYERLLGFLYNSRAASLGLPEWLGSGERSLDGFPHTERSSPMAITNVHGASLDGFQAQSHQVS